MKTLFKVLFVLSMLPISQAFATAKPGFGGDAVLCHDGANEVVEYYRARLLQNNPVDLGAGTYPQKVQTLISRLAKHFPLEAARARKALEVFENDHLSVQGSDLIGEAGSADLPLQSGCEIKKVILENVKRFNEDPSYYIQEDFWKKLSTDTKAGLVFEMLLFKASGFIDPEPGAYNYLNINAALAGKRTYPALRTPRDWADLIYPLNTAEEKDIYIRLAYSSTQYFLYDGVYHLRYQSRYYPNGQFASANTADGADLKGLTVNVFGHEIKAQSRYRFMESSLGFSTSGKITSFLPQQMSDLDFLKLPHKNISAFYVSADQSIYGYELEWATSDRIHGYSCPDLRGVQYYRSGELRALWCQSPMDVQFHGVKNPANFLTFAKEGNLIDARMYRPGLPCFDKACFTQTSFFLNN